MKRLPTGSERPLWTLAALPVLTQLAIVVIAGTVFAVVILLTGFLPSQAPWYDWSVPARKFAVIASAGLLFVVVVAPTVTVLVLRQVRRRSGRS